MTFLLQSPEVIEGIGPARAEDLAEAGIHTIADMFAARVQRVHELCANTSPEQVASWFCAAMLLRADGVTANFSEAFVNAGIRSIPQLAEAGLQTVERAAKRAVEKRQMAEMPSLYKLAALQREAWRARTRGMIAGRVLDPDGNPIAGVEIEVGRYDVVTDDLGRYAFDAIPEGETNIRFTIPGHWPYTSAALTITAGKMAGPLVHRLRAVPDTPIDIELDEMDGDLIVHTEPMRNRLRIKPLAEFRDGAHFLVRKIRDNGSARLLNLFKRRSRMEVIIERADVDAGDLPANTQVANILILESGALRSTDMTAAEVGELKHQLWSDAHPAASVSDSGTGGTNND